MAPSKLRIALILVIALRTLSAFGNSAPVIDSFTVTPAVPVPGQNVTIRIAAHDPECTAPSCTTACGTAIRSDLLVWMDDTGRTSGAFTGSTAAPTGSPWSASVTWIAPATEGTWTVRANVADNGGMLCGGRQAKLAALAINVSSARPPAIESCEVTPRTLPAGGTATLTARATDPLGRPVTYAFAADAGTLVQASPDTPSATWTAPKIAGSITLRCSAIAAGVAASLQTSAQVEIGAFLQRLATDGLRLTRLAPLVDGRIAAVDGTGGTLVLLNANANASVLWKVSDLRTPIAVAVDGSEIFVLEREARRVSVWNTSGTRLRELSLSLALPNQLVAGPGAGELAISDSGAARVVVISATDGHTLRAIGEGMLKVPAGLAASKGRLAVADAGASTVLIFGADGALQSTLGDATTLVRPQGVAWDSGNERLIVADSYSGELAIIGEENKLRGTLGGFGAAAGQIINPIDVSLLAGGILAVTTAGGDVPEYRLSATLLPLAPPQSVNAVDRTNDDGGAVVLSWTPSLDDPARVTLYRIERIGEAGDAPTVLATVARSSSSFVDVTASNVTCQRYRVVASDGAVEASSDVTPCLVARNDLAPAAPAALTASVESPSRATVSWAPVTATDLRGYTVTLTTNATAPIVRDVSVTTLSFADLIPGTTYDVAVRAQDTGSNASAPATTRMTMFEDAPPPAPAAVTVQDAGIGGTLEVSWTAPQSTLPIAKYSVDCTPVIDGWPSQSLNVTTTSTRIAHLVNQLAYRITVTAVTPWDRAGDPSTAQQATPTALVKTLPLIAATDDVEEAAGASFEFSLVADKRDLRFQYRSTGTAVQVGLDDSVVTTLADTNGAWIDASIVIEKRLLKGTALHRLDLRSSAFPATNTRLSLRRVDFVPLSPRGLKMNEYNTVADAVWTWDEPRADLGVLLQRDGTQVTCTAPRLGICRDTFLENGRQFAWSLRTVSPAGWMSDPVEVRAHAKWSEGPPPVTDVAMVELAEGLDLSWSPLSSAGTKDAGPVAVRAYRVYANGALLLEVTAPHAIVPKADPSTLTVRSVDAEGRESQ